MKGRWRPDHARLVAVLIAGWALGCGGEDSPLQPPPETDGAIEGSVTDEGSAPVVGAQLRLQARGSAVAIALTSAAADGSYRFAEVEAGDYDVLVTVPPAAEAASANPVPVTVGSGATVTADFVLRLLPVSFSAHIQPVFTANCALGGCHTGSNPPDGLNLSAGQAYGLTVNVPSVQVSSLDRIEPLDPANSYLIRKIEGSGIVANRMPLGGPPLPRPTIDALRRWVTEGAPDN